MLMEMCVALIIVKILRDTNFTGIYKFKQIKSYLSYFCDVNKTKVRIKNNCDVCKLTQIIRIKKAKKLKISKNKMWHIKIIKPKLRTLTWKCNHRAICVVEVTHILHYTKVHHIPLLHACQLRSSTTKITHDWMIGPHLITIIGSKFPTTTYFPSSATRYWAQIITIICTSSLPHNNWARSNSVHNHRHGLRHHAIALPRWVHVIWLTSDIGFLVGHFIIGLF